MILLKKKARQFLLKIPGINLVLDLFFYLKRKKRRCSAGNNSYLSSDALLKKYSVSKKHVFFGYYDKTPFSKNNERLLALVAPLPNCSPYRKKEALVGYFPFKKGNRFIRLVRRLHGAGTGLQTAMVSFH